jgi:N-methylhydantoinase B
MNVDPITVEVVRGYLDSLCTEMSTIVERCAMNPLFNEMHDYSTGIFYHDGDRVHLIGMSLETAVPNHIMPSSLSVESASDSYGGTLSEGDVVLLNDPYFGGTHTADWTLMTPVAIGDRG